jgi:hypothetical protein
MKKIFVFTIMIMITTFLSSPVFAYTSTGYNEFENIEILYRDDVYLLINTTLKTKKKNLEQVKWRFFGPSVYVKNSKVKVKYKKFDAFTRSNKTNNKLEYDYTYRFTLNGQFNLDQTYSTSSDVSAKIEIVNVAVEDSIKNAIGSSIELGVMKEVKYTITVDPHTKVTMYVTGDALLSQGAVKYYFFGIPIFKANWEYIDVVTEYYEFNEEIYN